MTTPKVDFIIRNCCEKMTEATKLRLIETYINTLEECIKIVVNGCCGGCTIINEVRFCPFCGVEILVEMIDNELAEKTR